MGSKCCQKSEKIRSTLLATQGKQTGQSAQANLKQQSVLSTAASGEENNENNKQGILFNLKKNRRKLWEFEHNYHCAIIGTCLSIQEVRNLLKRFQIKVNEFSDYDIHTIAVTMIENNDSRTKKINAHLDRKFKSALNEVKKMDKGELQAYWRLALKEGDVIESFWAIMTHPLADSQMQKNIYGDIHMLSHLSGASNRADIKRLKTLQSEQIALSNELKTIKQNNLKKHTEIDSLKQELQEKESLLSFYKKKVDSLAQINEQLLKLNSEKQRQDLEQQVQKQLKKIEQLQYRMEQQQQRNFQLIEENERLEGQLNQAQCQMGLLANQHAVQSGQVMNSLGSQSDACEQCDHCELKDEDLCGRCILYVGGHTSMAPHYREIIEAKSGVFLHHDGGIEKNKQELSSLLKRADLVICPTNCISHNAYWQIKKTCKKENKPCKFIPSSGLSSLSTVLDNLVLEQN